MTRRLLAALALTACAGGVFAAPAAAHEDEPGWICIGGDNQRKPGYYTICIDRLPGTGIVFE